MAHFRDPLGKIGVLILVLIAASVLAGIRAQEPVPPADKGARRSQDDDILKDDRLRQAVADQQTRLLVDEAIRRAKRMLRTDPDDSHEMLKRTLDGVRNNPDITESARAALVEQLELALQDNDRQGLRIKRDQAEAQALKALRDAQASREELEKQLRAKLAKQINFAGFDDPKTTLAEALDQLQKRHDLIFIVNERAFRFDGVADVLKTEVAQPTPVPPLPNANLKTVLEKLLARVPASSGAVVLVVGGQIEITTGQSAHFKVPADTPLEKFLPVPPRAGPRTGPLLGDDLGQVPEVAFQELPAKDVEPEKALEETARQMARIGYLNETRTDAFLELLRSRRPDLAGLPFLLGDACRSPSERNALFAPEALLIRRSAGGPAEMPTFWERYLPTALERDNDPKVARSGPDAVLAARIAALMQILWSEDDATRLGLAKYLTTVPHAEATQALARLALFAPEEEVRRSAVKALQVRRERDYTELLMQGFRYPWPAAARRAGEALAALGRTDLVPRLVDVLEEPDPRLPMVKEVEGKQAPEVRELVRVNHHRNCLLCHAPMNPRLVSVNPSTVMAAVPIPGQPLPVQVQAYYSDSQPEILVRADVAYLSQDFALQQRVPNAEPWPEMQRFDFLVRTRTLSDEEAQSYRAKLQLREPGVLSPYHRAALAALRELTGKDAAPAAQSLAQLLGQNDAGRRGQAP